MLAGDHNLGNLSNTTSSSWLKSEEIKAFDDAVKDFNNKLGALANSQKEASRAADSLQSWTALGQKALEIALPIIEQELQKRSAENEEPPATISSRVTDALTEFENLRTSLQPIFDRLSAKKPQLRNLLGFTLGGPTGPPG